MKDYFFQSNFFKTSINTNINNFSYAILNLDSDIEALFFITQFTFFLSITIHKTSTKLYLTL